MLSTKSWRVYRVLLSIALILILIPTVGMCFYTRPSADDLAQPLPVALTWRETGSVMKTIASAFRTMADIYVERNAIFFSMLLSVIPLSVFRLEWYWLNAVLAIVLLLLACRYAASVLPCIFQGINRDVCACAGLLVCLSVFLFMPSYHEAIYWFSGAANYTYTICMSIFLFAGWIKVCLTNRVVWWRMVLWCLGMFCLGGANWMTPTSSIVLCGALTVWILYTKRPARLLIPFAFLLLGYLVAVLSPGNANRQASMNVDTTLFEAFFQSFRRGFAFFFNDKRCLLFTLLFVPIAKELLDHSRISFRYALWLPVLSLCLMAATMFPVVYQSSYWNERHTNTCFLLLVFLLPVNLFWLMGWAVRKLQLPPREKPAGGKALLACAMAVMLAIGALSVPGMTLKPLRFNCTLQPVTAMMHLIDGQARDYAQWYDSVADMVRTHAGEDVILREMRANELINPGYLVIDDPADWQNTSFARYFGDENTTITYQP